MSFIKSVVCAFLFLVLSAAAFAKESADEKIKAIFFHSPRCHACLKYKKEIMPKFLKQYGSVVEFQDLDVTVEANYAQLVSACKLQSKEPAYPAVFIEGRLIIGVDDLTKQLPVIVDEILKKKNKPAPVSDDQKAAIEDIFKKFTVGAIALAGLVDGINPCAFTVIIFFISMLTVYGYRKRELAVIGGSYIAAVFLVYLGLGLGLFNFLYAFQHFFFLMKALYIGVSILCFVLGVLCLIDFVRFRRTGNAEMSVLQLPPAIKNRIRDVIGDEFRPRGKTTLALSAGAFSVGALVSLLEAVCTGQVYLPVITFVMNRPELRAKAVSFFVLYNFMFVIPLIAVFLLAMWGVGSQQFAAYYQRKFGFVRICMFMVFMALGFYMLGS
jgi:cytochrome c biogenesis protein CcdA